MACSPEGFGCRMLDRNHYPVPHNPMPADHRRSHRLVDHRRSRRLVDRRRSRRLVDRRRSRRLVDRRRSRRLADHRHSRRLDRRRSHRLVDRRRSRHLVDRRSRQTALGSNIHPSRSDHRETDRSERRLRSCSASYPLDRPNCWLHTPFNVNRATFRKISQRSQRCGRRSPQSPTLSVLPIAHPGCAFDPYTLIRSSHTACPSSSCAPQDLDPRFPIKYFIYTSHNRFTLMRSNSIRQRLGEPHSEFDRKPPPPSIASEHKSPL